MMALDIASLQADYGANTTHNSARSIYDLSNSNAAGTFYESIWDTGGTDSIEYLGSRDATIDPRAATLEYEYGGGGFISYVVGIHGGFMIANGVVIENVTGGSGNDLLVGNGAANVLDGGAGGLGTASYVQSDAAVTLNLLTNALLGGHAAGDSFVSIENLTGSSFADTLTGDDGANVIRGGAGNDLVKGGSGADTITGGTGNDLLFGQAGVDSFIFESGWGDDKIYDFKVNSEKMDMSALNIGFSNLSITSSGSNTVISYGSDSITLIGVSSSSVDSGDFIF